MALLRRRFRYRTFLSGAHDVLEPRPVFSSLADTTHAAEDAVAAAWAMADRPQGIAIFALGRLGTLEFDFLSDADLLFVRDKRTAPVAALHAAEDMVHSLSAYTSDGTAMAVDLRLRPHGGEGEMVATNDQLRSYFQTEAQAWEALTYNKLRFIAGSKHLAVEAATLTASLREKFASSGSFGAEVIEMRTKLEQSDPTLKTIPGGSYDIDFLLSYLVIRHRLHTIQGTTVHRLLELGRAGILAHRDVQVLLDALELFRSADHAIRLVTARRGKTFPVSDIARASVAELTRRMTTLEFSGSLEDQLDSVRLRVREIFSRMVR
jgi:glutamate-ammonia-ligase adenylyltransferase